MHVLGKVEKKVDEVLNQMKMLMPDVSSYDSQTDKIVRKLDIVKAGLDVKTVASELKILQRSLMKFLLSRKMMRIFNPLITLMLKKN